MTGQSGVLRCVTKQLNDDGEKGQPERIQVKGAEHLGWRSGMSQLGCFSLLSSYGS